MSDTRHRAIRVIPANRTSPVKVALNEAGFHIFTIRASGEEQKKHALVTVYVPVGIMRRAGDVIDARLAAVNIALKLYASFESPEDQGKKIMGRAFDYLIFGAGPPHYRSDAGRTTRMFDPRIAPVDGPCPLCERFGPPE